MIDYRSKAFPSGEGGPAQAGSDEAGMNPDQYALKKPFVKTAKQDNGFSVYLGLAQTFGAYQPHPPQCAHWGTFPKGEGFAPLNDHLSEELGVRRSHYQFWKFLGKSVPRFGNLW